MKRNDWDKWAVIIDNGMRSLERAMDRAFEDELRAVSKGVEKGDNENVIRLEVPGSGPEDVTLTLEDTILVIRATNPIRNTTDYFKYRVSRNVDTDAIEATVKNGILTVVLKQKTDTKKSVTIQVK